MDVQPHIQISDEGQADAVMHLENLFEALQPEQQSQSFGPIRRLFGFGKQAKNTVKGLYLYLIECMR